MSFIMPKYHHPDFSEERFLVFVSWKEGRQCIKMASGAALFIAAALT